MIACVFAKTGYVAVFSAAAVVLQGCATAVPAPPSGASPQGCWTYTQSWRGGGSPAQQPAPVRTWTNDPKACGKVQTPSD